MRTGLVFGVLAAVMAIAQSSLATDLKLEKGDRICLIGNALGERLQHYNHCIRVYSRRHSGLA